MRYKLAQHTEKIFTPFWRIPSLIATTLILLCFAMMYLDSIQVAPKLKMYLEQLISIQHAETTLEIVASAAITITSITFSITVLTLSLVSRQLGSRLLPNFMRQKIPQIVLGSFIGTFIYCLIVIQSLTAFNRTNTTPCLSIILGTLLGVVCFFLLVIFIQFVCKIIQLDNVLKTLTDNIIQTIDNQLPTLNNKPCKHAVNRLINQRAPHEEAIKHKHYTALQFKKSGYIQCIDYDEIFKLALKNDLFIKLTVKTGDFIIKQQTTIEIYSDKVLPNKIKSSCLNAFEIAHWRSSTQDLEYAFEELSEIAIRAMSPSINDPYAAIHCLNRIIEGLAALTNKGMLSKLLCDKQGIPRVQRQTLSYQDIVKTTFNRFRQQAKLDLSVSIHILNSFNTLLHLKMPQELKKSLLAQAKLVYEDSSAAKLNHSDKQDLDFFYNQVHKNNVE